jgi:hypothetical protein
METSSIQITFPSFLIPFHSIPFLSNLGAQCKISMFSVKARKNNQIQYSMRNWELCASGSDICLPKVLGAQAFTVIQIPDTRYQIPDTIVFVRVTGSLLQSSSRPWGLEGQGSCCWCWTVGRENLNLLWKVWTDYSVLELERRLSFWAEQNR